MAINTKIKKFILVKDTDSILHTRMPLYNGNCSDIREIAPDLFKFMKKKGGIGLAAPQVGIKQNFFIMEVSKPKVVINPFIVQQSLAVKIMAEGCLSFPNLRLEIARPETVTVSYVNENNGIVVEDLTGLEARCFLHEFDHLCGKVFTEYQK